MISIHLYHGKLKKKKKKKKEKPKISLKLGVCFLT